MRVYLAGYYSGKAAETQTDYPWILESYFYIAKHNGRVERECSAEGKTLFVDSGAFSMFTQKVDISIQQYGEWLLANKPLWHIASNLDDVTKNEAKSYENQKILEAMGCPVVPVFHCREDVKWLQRYIEEGYEYLFLGGMVPESTPYLLQWLDNLFDKYLTDKDGMPIIKVHGFGLTRLNLVDRYPWFSVDSTSWVMTGRFGGIFLRLPHNPSFKLAISDQSPKTKDFDGHYDTLAPAVKEAVDQIIKAKGFDPEQLRTHYPARDLWNIRFLEEWNSMPTKPFKKQVMELF